jgi:flagellar biosynthesis protein FliQ
MKKNILIFGLISGLIVSAMMAFTAINCYQTGAFEGSMVVGFSVMIIAFSFIFVAVKNYRDKFNGGAVSFVKAFQIGIIITAIGSTMYVVSWLIIYYNFYPDYMQRFIQHEIVQIKAEGLSLAETNKKISELDFYDQMYKSPIMVILFTYLEVFPIGLIVSVLSALVLKKKPAALNGALAV